MGKRICLGLLVCVLAFAWSAPAQEVTGGIQGTVKDPQGAVIPGATVEVSSPALIGKKTVTTDSGGYFHFDQLPPGVYSIAVNAAGFAPQTQGNLELRTGALPTVAITMQVGGIWLEETFCDRYFARCAYLTGRVSNPRHGHKTKILLTSDR